MVYQKGESPQTAAYVWGESISEILKDATVRLGIHKGGKSLYDESGARVTSFEAIERDSLLCVTSGDSLRGRREFIVRSRDVGPKRLLFIATCPRI